METTSLDQQLAPALGYLAALLRSGYSLRQSIEGLAEDAPVPLAGVFRQLTDDLKAGVERQTIRAEIQRRFGSAYLDRCLASLLHQPQFGEALLYNLTHLGLAIRERVGSAGATAAQRDRLAQLATEVVPWALCEPVAPRPWAPGPPIHALLDDPEITTILVNGPYSIEIVRQGQLECLDAHFLDEAELQAWLHDVLTPLSLTIDAQQPILNLHLADDSLISVVAPPLSASGIAVVLRKAPPRLSADDLLRFGSWNETILDFLRACVRSRINLLVAGGFASGKTTLMEVLCAMIPEAERVITLEATRELRLNRQRLLALEAKPSISDGQSWSLAKLLEQALLMLPDRLVLGELQGPEVLPLLQAINAGYNGTLLLMHATSPRDALLRLEQLITMTEPAIPLRAVRHELASALQLIVQHNRLANGQRRVVALSEVVGMEGDVIVLRDIFRFEPDEGGGRFVVTGHRPAFLAQLEGYELPMPSSHEALPASSHALEAQLGETTALMAACLGAGYSFMQTLGMLAQELPAPIGELLTTVVQAVGAGEPISEALAALTREHHAPSLQLLIDTILQQRREGGNLAEGLARLEAQLRESGGADPSLAAVSERLRARYGLPTRAR